MSDDPGPSARRGTAGAPLDPRITDALVFGCSAAVLVLEILAIRLLAPYAGLTLEVTTSIIGVVLAGIAAGAVLGGRLADAGRPEPLLAAEVLAGGLLTLAVVPALRLVGPGIGGSAGATVVVALGVLGPPAAVLSAVTPTVAKLRLRDLGRSGTVVGRLSALGTAGALVGTFGTGFVLVPLLPVSATVLALGVLLALTGALLGGHAVRGRSRAVAPLAALAALLVLAGAALGSPCQEETTYHCARVVEEPGHPGARTLVLDELRHSTVDPDDPRHLGFAYVRWIAGLVDVAHAGGRPLDAVHVGAGAMTLPRWLGATRPGSRSTVLEIDGRLVGFVRERLPMPAEARTRVVVGDARLTLRDVPSRSADLVIGDAVSSRAVPWHLATTAFLRDVRRVLRPRGVLAMNVIDGGDLRLLRAQAATLLEVLPHVVLVRPRKRGPGANFVLLGARRRVDPAGASARLDDPSVDVLGTAAVRRLAGDARVLRDDHAPTDQLLPG